MILKCFRASNQQIQMHPANLILVAFIFVSLLSSIYLLCNDFPIPTNFFLPFFILIQLKLNKKIFFLEYVTKFVFMIMLIKCGWSNIIGWLIGILRLAVTYLWVFSFTSTGLRWKNYFRATGKTILLKFFHFLSIRIRCWKRERPKWN